ncbi:uncharacterized protein [Paramormyrops kingsleyae]
MFEFRFNGRLWCVDAAQEDQSLGRLVNDNHIDPNTKMKKIVRERKPHLCLFAIKDIAPGEEITYDYGDSEWPWRCKANSEVESMILSLTPTSSTLTNSAEQMFGAVSSEGNQNNESHSSSKTTSELQEPTTSCVSQANSEVESMILSLTPTSSTLTNGAEQMFGAVSSEGNQNNESHSSSKTTSELQEPTTSCVSQANSEVESMILSLTPTSSTLTNGAEQMFGAVSSEGNQNNESHSSSKTTSELQEPTTSCVSQANSEVESMILSLTPTSSTLTNGAEQMFGAVSSEGNQNNESHSSSKTTSELQEPTTSCVSQANSEVESMILSLTPTSSTLTNGAEQMFGAVSSEGNQNNESHSSSKTTSELQEPTTSCVSQANSEVESMILSLTPTSSTLTNGAEQMFGAVSSEGNQTNESHSSSKTTSELQEPTTTCVSQCKKHDLVSTTVSTLEKCGRCTGPVSSFKWLGFKCRAGSGVWHKSCLPHKLKQFPELSGDSSSAEDPQTSDLDEDYVPDSESDDDSSSSEAKVLKVQVHQPLRVEEVMGATSVCSDDSRNPTKASSENQNPRPNEQCSQSQKLLFTVSNKKNYCYVCGKPKSKIARHLETHKTEPEIAEALSFPKHSKDRKRLLETLRNRGNYQHNSDVLKSGEGSLKVKRKTNAEQEPGLKFVHCVYCKGMFVRKDLWRHNRRCPSKPGQVGEEIGRTRVLRLATACDFEVSQHISTGVWKLLNPMKPDEITSLVRNDFCVLQLAQSFYNKHGHDSTKYEYIRQKLREIGRLLLVLRSESSIYSIEEAVKPANFHKVVQAVRKVSGYNEEHHCYKTPSLALKLGHSLQKLCDIIHCRALMAEDNERMKSTEAFKKLCSSKWSELVSHTALTTLSAMKFNKPSTLPFTQDVQLLHEHLEKTSRNAFSSLTENVCPTHYAVLAKSTLAQIIVFNRRRAGEVSKMHLKHFYERDQTDLHKDVAMGLTNFEQKLCNHFSRIEIMGKRGRKVAVLLTPNMVEALTLLVSKRSECGVDGANVFLFGRPKCLSHYRGQDSLRIHAGLCGAKNPQFLRSTQLRKHVATLSQILNLKKNELDQLADFLGHDIRVHRDYYRLPEATTQLAKISKLLLAMEKGCLPELQGKSLADIEIEDHIQLSDPEDECRDSDGVESSDSAESAGVTVNNEAEVSTSMEHVTDDGVSLGGAERIETPKRMTKMKWSKAEVAAVMKYFKRHIETGKLATKAECEQCKVAEHPLLENRSLQNIRDFVRNRGLTVKRRNQKLN